MKRNWWLYLFVLPAIIWYIVFHYVPMGGVIIAFKRYTGVQTIWESRWVGLKWFKSFFNSYYCKTIIKNTLVLSTYSLLTFPLPIIFALVLNEMKNAKVKKVIQTITYAPHFISIVVLVSMMNLFFTTQNGFVNNIITFFGGQPFDFLTSSKAFPPVQWPARQARKTARRLYAEDASSMQQLVAKIISTSGGAIHSTTHATRASA